MLNLLKDDNKGYTYNNLRNNYGFSEELTKLLLQTTKEYTPHELRLLLEINDIICLNMYDKHEIAHVIMWLYLMHTIDENVYKYFNNEISNFYCY